MKILVTIFVIILLTTVVTYGQIINVPGDQPTIQSAINASVDGDTVLVADGTYFENINYKGKAITLASWFLVDGDETHIDSTIINGSKPTNPDSGSVVNFNSGEDTTSVLYGFTITGGTGVIDHYGYGSLGGGGVAQTEVNNGDVSGTWTKANSPYFILGEITVPNDSTLTIEPGVEVTFKGHYKFNIQGRLLAIGTKNDSIKFSAENESEGWWGVRFRNTPSTNDTSKIIYCSFKNGNANSGDNSDRSGGAIFITEFNKVLISNCLFDSNTQSGDIFNTGGPAVCIYNASGIITNSTFTNNWGPADGAICCWGMSKTIISNNIISKNNGSWGAIICGGSLENRPTISGNVISHNVASVEGGGIDATWETNALILNNIIIYNKAHYGGGIRFIDTKSTDGPIAINNTIAYNYGDFGGGIDFTDNSDPILINNIIFGNSSGSNGNQVHILTTNADPRFFFNDVQGGTAQFGGAGSGSNYTGLYQNNIDSDPLFADTTNFYLATSSSCIDAGDPNGIFNDVEDPYNPGFPLYPALGDLRNDMGAYGGNPYMIYAHVPSLLIQNCSLNSTYQVPGIDTLIVTSEISRTENQLVEVQAIITSFDNTQGDSIPMFDNGVYPDKIAGDGIYSGFWSIPNNEENYNVDVSTYLSKYDYLVLLENAASFTTKGPAKINDVEFLSDTVVGSRITFNLTLENFGLTDSLNDVTIDFLIPEDAGYRNGSTGSSTFGDIAPGESKKCSRYYGIIFDDSCSTDSPYEIEVAIKSKNIVYWYDTLKINLIPTDIEDEASNLPKEYALNQNYPNPFNPSTKIKYAIPAVETGHVPTVRLVVFDILGREVATLVNEQQKAGYYEVNFNASSLTSGIYFYKLNVYAPGRAGSSSAGSGQSFVETKKMILLR